MKRYIGTKIIFAEPMTQNEFLELFPKRERTALLDEGYHVRYENGYDSWSPADIFEKAYRFTSNLSFGLALEAMKMGKKCSRKKWAVGWFVSLSKDNRYLIKQSPSGSTEIDWPPEQNEILADDWYIVD